MKLNSFSISQEGDIPRTQGLYAFHLELISPARVGLLGRGEFSKEQLAVAKENLKNRTEKLLRFVRSNFFSGVISGSKKGFHISEKYFLEAKEQFPSSLVQELDRIPDNHLYQYLRISKLLSAFAQPIYVGITKNQTLQERYFQHKYDFISNTDASTFGTRLRKAGFDWDEVVFSCIPLSSSEGNIEILSLLEKQLQAIARPVLSER